MAIRGSSGVVSPRVQWPSSGGWPWSGLGAVQSRLALLEHREDDGGTSARLVRGLSAMVRGPAGRRRLPNGSPAQGRAAGAADAGSLGTPRNTATGRALRGGSENCPDVSYLGASTTHE